MKNANDTTPIQIKVILSKGNVLMVLKNQDIPMEVEIVHDDPDYPDHELLAKYQDKLIADSAFMSCQFTSADFTEEPAISNTKNTKISYLYRDAENNHVHNECVVKGCITKEMKASILDCLDMGEYFIPEQVGLPERTLIDEGYDYDATIDHPWFELGSNCFEETEDAPTVDMTAQQLVAKFLERRGNWNCPF